ncbi:polycystic kidney disease 2-like 2 protein [Rhinatrema bivittatum]|uniref:polycystic kidney disease 2-like 2 protein n=1 Tax=Rhinatrema bivittatum TaxID=194408 RepID=UPI00112BE2B1|nr:polycystic kidney disease 2-like 2 protein [Rhinatrema bivittatum]XP_029439907.1 polycystic kidney disease 2-like 2 protein [Rhinatrema bivittatum]
MDSSDNLTSSSRERLMGQRRMSGLMAPRMSYSRELQIKTTLQELLIYIIFLTDTCILSFGMVNSNMYYLNKVLENLFLESSGPDSPNFKSVRSMEDFWKFAEGSLLESLYWTTWYNNKTLAENQSYIYYENLLLGVPQLRQLKVRNNTCIVHPYFRNFTKTCYGSYSFMHEDRAPFRFKNASEWLYSHSPFGEWYWGKINIYSGGGYSVILTTKKEDSLSLIQYLKRNSWLTRGTRVVFIDFSVYNANLNLFCVIRLITEFPATGGAIPSWRFYSVKLLRYVTFYDYFLGSCEVIFFLFTCAFVIQEIMKLNKQKWDYFKSVWNLLDVLLVQISFTSIGFNLYRTTQVSLLIEKLLSTPNQYSDFQFLAYWQTQYNNMIAITVFFAWIKIFKFISFNRTMSQLSSTLSRCAKDIIGFAIMFFIIFFSYAQLGFLLFGSQVDEFSSFANCIFTQFRIILGDFNFADIEQANRILGPLYFITFVFFVFFVLLNMFLAIINDTYSEVKADYSVRTNEFEISDLIRESYERALVKLKLKKAITKDINRDIIEAGGKLNVKKVKDDLKAQGYSAAETEEILRDYERNKDNMDLDEEESLSSPQQQKLRERLKGHYNKQEDLGSHRGKTGHIGQYKKSEEISEETDKLLPRGKSEL